MLRTLAALASITLTAPAMAQEEEAPDAPSPATILDAASAEDWVMIPPEDLLVMTLAPDQDGDPREVVIQLMPEPFSQGWVENIRTLARARWYDGISVNRVQDNYVVQWGDPGHDNPESGEVDTKPLPEGLRVMEEEDYLADPPFGGGNSPLTHYQGQPTASSPTRVSGRIAFRGNPAWIGESYWKGFPIAGELTPHGFPVWPVHCYGMVGVGRGYSPDTGTGAELYTVIGHAPRHLDRNIALIGRVIDGMEQLSSLPRGSGALGFYTEEEADKRTPILSIRVAADLPEDEQPRFEYLSTTSATFARYAEARANRRDPFFIHPAGGADICNIPVPVRALTNGGPE